MRLITHFSLSDTPQRTATRRRTASHITLASLSALTVGGLIACSAENPGTESPTDGNGGDTGGVSLDPGGVGGSTSGGSLDDLLGEPPTENCGDGILHEDEACDDGNLQAGDGCHSNCRVVEPGFTCSVPGEPCKPFAKCGDGILRFPEQCDDENVTSGDGCSANCKMEIGFKCSGEPSTCEETVCGDSVIEGAEGCDDGNDIPFDGCDQHCQFEPSCTGSPGTTSGCQSRCGDGLVMGAEECDDGNDVNGDGCSSDCEEEEGYECKQAPCETIDDECVLRVAAVFRDFNQSHTDFQVGCGQFTTGVVEDALDGERKPVLLDNSGVCIENATSFKQWYRDDPVNSTAVSDIVLFDDGAGGFVNRFGTKGDGESNVQYDGLDGNPLFFPLDEFPNCMAGERQQCALADTRHTASIPQEHYGGSWAAEDPAVPHNFHFTSEVAFWFEYDAANPPTLTFLGDDDVWVFINGKLAVDLGGLHVPIEGSVTLNSTTNTNLGLGLADGNVYPIRVFHAERKTTGSSFLLTLAGFDVSRSECLPECGDGIVAGSEECDDGVNDGGYNECQPGCVLGGYCGDGIRQENEQCDDNEPDAPDGCSGCRILVVK